MELVFELLVEQAQQTGEIPSAESSDLIAGVLFTFLPSPAGGLLPATNPRSVARRSTAVWSMSFCGS